MEWIKTKFLWIAAAIAGVATLTARYFYYQSVKANTKLKQGDAKHVAELEKQKLESLQRDIKGAEEYRKSLVDQWRSHNNPKSGR